MIYYLRIFYKKINKKIDQKIKIAKIQHEIRRSKIRIMTIDETIDCLEQGKSIARFGDGELDLILGQNIGYQSADGSLSKALMDILISKPDNCLIGIPDAISTLDNLTQNSLNFWIPNMARYRGKWISLLTKLPDPYYFYANTNVSRCYIRYQDKSNSKRWFYRLMNIWKDRDVVVVEGEKTRLGCGNDFLKMAKSVRRILGPAENAFDKKNDIFNYIISNIEKTAIIVLALGPTATILAYELAQQNYQALDLGHCDIEYEWCLMGVTEKVAVRGKYTNEVSGGRSVEDSIIDKKYLKEVMKRFLN